MEGARALYIEEFGLTKQASADTHQIWLRAGAIINPTRYNRIDGKGTEKNWAIYALADYQLIQPDKAQPYRGHYIGGSMLIAPDAVNDFKQTFEGRAYAMGLIPGRPGGSINFTVDYNRFSTTGGDALALQGQVTHRYQFSAGLLYSIGVTHGVFLQPSATYVRNPSFTGTYKPAINLATSLTFVL